VFISCDFFFLQAGDGIRDYKVTGVQTCALPICYKKIAGKKNRFASGNRRKKVFVNNQEVFSGIPKTNHRISTCNQ